MREGMTMSAALPNPRVGREKRWQSWKAAIGATTPRIPVKKVCTLM
jgi:hypothetical protein